jgi:hypothetical protein
MPDIANIAVLQDFTCIAGLAFFLGLLGYKWLRLMRPEAAWNYEGLVTSRQYGEADPQAWLCCSRASCSRLLGCRRILHLFRV